MTNAKRFAIALLALVGCVRLGALDLSLGGIVLVGYFNNSGDEYETFVESRNGEKTFGFGVTSGIVLELDFLPYLGARVELLYTYGGASFKFDEVFPAESEVRAKELVHLAEVPILLTSRFGPARRPIRVFLGPCMQLQLTDDDSWIRFTAKNDEVQEYYDETGAGLLRLGGLESVGLALVVGGGTSFPLGPGALLVETRFVKPVWGVLGSDGNRYWYVLGGAGYVFRFKRQSRPRL